MIDLDFKIDGGRETLVLVVMKKRRNRKSADLLQCSKKVKISFDNQVFKKTNILQKSIVVRARYFKSELGYIIAVFFGLVIVQ